MSVPYGGRRQFGSDWPPGLSGHAVAWLMVAFSHCTGREACPYYDGDSISQELDPPN